MSKLSKNMMHAIANALLKKLKKWQKKERRYTHSLVSGDWTYSTALSCFSIQIVVIICPHIEITSSMLHLLQCSSRKTKKSGRRKWKRPWDKKLLLLMPKQPKLTRASTNMLCHQQTMCYWMISQKVRKQQQRHDSDSTCTSFMQGILPASSCHLPGLTGRFTSRLSICHSYKISSSCAGTLYMVFLFVQTHFCSC